MKQVDILLVEDNAADAAFIKAILDPNEFKLTVASRLGDAVSILRERRMDAALLDMTLPDGRGIDGIHRLHEIVPGLPVVILTGEDDERLAMAAVQSGAQDYLLKGNATALSLRRALRYAIERQDLTDRLSVSIGELERQRASVLLLNQLKNDLIAVLAHDIKGPLTSIMGYAELLEEGSVEGGAATDAARTIRNNAQRLATLANDVLALSRVEHGELDIADDRVNLVDLLKSVVESFGDKHSIALACESAEAFVRGDEGRLRQVFDNLIGNAIKYSTDAQPISVSLVCDGDTFRVAVVDDGIGVPKEDLPHLFERFSRGSNAKRAKIQGTGIGLFIVKMIVERHGGEVFVASSVGHGSTFTVVLPNLEAATARGPMRVSIVSGDSDLRRFVAYELRSRGYRVRECAKMSDIERVGELRSGDVALIDTASVRADEIAPLVPTGGHIRIVGIGAPENVAGYDALLPRPFLVAELLRAIGDTATVLVKS